MSTKGKVSTVLGVFFTAVIAATAGTLNRPKPPKPCSIFMHSFEPPMGYIRARSIPIEGERPAVLYLYEDGSGVMIFAPREKGIKP